jgi:hypothetical protein
MLNVFTYSLNGIIFLTPLTLLTVKFPFKFKAVYLNLSMSVGE